MPFVFGYGSLLNCSYRAVSYATLIPNPDFPVRRAFNAHREFVFSESSTKYTALGLEYVPLGLATFVNGLVIEVTAEQLSHLIEREAGYRQIRLDACCFTGLPTGIESDIIVFIPETPEYPTEEYPLSKDYIDICLEGFCRCNLQYAVDFLRLTSGWSPDLLEYALSKLQ